MIETFLKQIFNDDNILIKNISRLKHKNLVYYVKKGDKEYAVKVYFQGVDKLDRYSTEKLLYEYFNKTNLINIPTNIFLSDSYPILITKWIKGTSLKKKLKKEGLQNNLQDIAIILNQFNKIWNINDKNLINHLKTNEIGLFNRNKIEEEQIFNKIINSHQNINFDEIIKLYYVLKKNLELNNLKVINSDVSAHEFIKENDIYYFLDFERFCLGDPNNDLARLFFSISETLEEKEIYELYSLFENNSYFEKLSFIYYFIEKLLGNLYISPFDMSEEKIIFFINFALNLYQKKDKIKSL